MIISKTPFRISFFGGGTDYPLWYRNNGGAVLSTTIDKYCYITLRYLPPFFEHRYRVVYSKVEKVKKIDEIQHPAVKSLLKYFKIKDGVELHHDGDLPARSGLGSSSAFTVGLINALYALKGTMVPKYRLAMDAIHLERDILKECVGSQDQVAVSYGGFNKISFSKDNKFYVEPIIMSPKKLEELQSHLVLYFTGLSRIASKVAKKQVSLIPKSEKQLFAMHRKVDEARDLLAKGEDIKNFGKLLHESWQLKKCLTDRISNPMIDDIYNAAISAGATGGKLLGAGAGGFMLLFVKPSMQARLKKRLKNLLEVKFNFESAGSQIIFYRDQGMR
jgi:D-glycero-alpha-D-manno-heptose-7-phosphate kinase